MICFDFAENYAFVVQNSAQSFHWNKNQNAIFTVVIYYKDGGELKQKYLAHDTVAVHEYQTIIINYLKNNFEPKKIHYFTDGAGNISRIKVALLILANICQNEKKLKCSIKNTRSPEMRLNY